MIGFGSYGGNVHGGGSSNLSALAPPFTVDRSIQKPTATPLVDLGEPLNWLDTNPYTFNSPQPAQFPRLDLDPITTPSYNQNSDLFEPQTYYSSNVSPPFHVPSFNEHSSSGLDHTAQWGGGLWDWEKGNAHLGGSFYSKETNVAPSSIYTDHINLGNPCEILISDENGNVEDGSVSSLKWPSLSIPSFREHQPDDAGKAGSYHKKTSPACEIKFSDDASERKKDYVLFNYSMDEVEKASCSIQQSLAEGRLASKNLRASETAVADVEMKINDVSSGCGSSHMSCHAVKNFSCSPSSVEDISAKHSKFLGKEPVSSSSISVLVDTMHNLSELLLYHCCTETCELKEQDLKSLEKVIYNLDTCMSKNIGQESFLSELHEGTSMGRAQVGAIDVLSQHVQEKRKHSGKKDEKCSDFVSVKSGTDIKVKNDKMTQAIKKVLTENFHEKEEAHPQVLLYKNLWLEAEAALCSINYMARFNNMKIEIEKCKLDSEKDLLEDTPDEDKISRSKFSAEVKTNKKLTAVAESGSTPAVSNQNSPIKSSSNHADDVTARFHVLKRRLNNSNSVHSRDGDELSSSNLSLDLDEVDKLATEVKDSSTPGLSSQDSPVPGTACHTDDVEASVMARFHILKSRGIDDLDSNEMERKLLPGVVDLGFAGKRKQIPLDKDTSEDGISGVNLEPVSQHQVANHAGEQLVVKDFHLCVMHDSTIQSPGSTRLGNQLSAGCYDSCSSDWEHVLKEELSGQNS